MGLVARHLEEHGIPTAIVGAALDIIEHCGVPRFLFSDFPLGNPCGRPYEVEMQRAIVRSALGLLEEASGPRTIVRTPFDWGDDAWREGFMRVDPADRERLRRAGERRRELQARAKARARERGEDRRE